MFGGSDFHFLSLEWAKCCFGMGMPRSMPIVLFLSAQNDRTCSSADKIQVVSVKSLGPEMSKFHGIPFLEVW